MKKGRLDRRCIFHPSSLHPSSFLLPPSAFLLCLSPMTWHVYILRCGDGTLYTGVTTDVERRARQHNAGTAARYTRGRGPLEVVYRETHEGRGSALRREAALKSLSRREKERLVRTSRLEEPTTSSERRPYSGPGRSATSCELPCSDGCAPSPRPCRAAARRRAPPS
jgi:putative endonuclease